MHPLCDTNILSELSRPRPNGGVLEWSRSVSTVTVSVVTVEEIHYGLTWKPRPRTLAWFERFLEQHCVVLPITEEISRVAGTLRGRLQATGETRSQADMLIAATAVVLGTTIVTRNTADFDGCGVTLLDPFS